MQKDFANSSKNDIEQFYKTISQKVRYFREQKYNSVRFGFRYRYKRFFQYMIFNRLIFITKKNRFQMTKGNALVVQVWNDGDFEIPS